MMNLAPERRELLAQLLATEGFRPSLHESISPRHSNAPAPLSFAQQRLWFLQQLNPESAVYNISLAVRCTETLNVPALAQSFSEIVRRHEVLRTRITSSSGVATQVVGPAEAVELNLVDLSALPVTKREQLLQQILDEDDRRPFDLEHDSLLRLRLLKLAPRDHVLLICIHHIISDGWSTEIMIRELTELYEAFSSGRPSPLAELLVQYADFAEWQRNRLQGNVLDDELQYWKGKLEGRREVSELPADHTRPPLPTDRGEVRTLSLPAKRVRALRQLCEEHNVTMFMLLLAALQVLLYRYTGDPDVVVGSPTANRNRSEIEPLIGFFVNMLVLRSDLAGDPGFADLLAHVRTDTLSAYEHQDVPFEKLVEALNLDRHWLSNPLFQVSFVLQTANLDVDAGVTQELKLRPLNAGPQKAKFDLTLLAEERSDELIYSLEYKTELFEPATIDCLLAHYGRLLESIVEQPEQRLSELSILTSEERDQILSQNAVLDGRILEGTLPDRFEARVAEAPDAVAVVFEDQQLSYAQLNARANRLAHLMQQQGIGPESLVAICLERSPELLTAIVATMKSGAAYLPLDPHYPEERLSFMLRDSSAAMVITNSSQPKLEAHKAHVINLDEHATLIASQSDDNPLRHGDSQNLAYVIYTSGSTGKPKGVMITHENVLRLFAATDHQFNFGRDDVWSLFHSYAFDFSVWELWGALLYGGQLVVVPHLTCRSPQAFYQLVADTQVTVLNQTPSAFRQFMRVDEECPANLALRKVIFAGEALELATLRGWVQRRGADRTRLINMYGITETTVHVTYRQVLAEEVLGSTGSVIGRAMSDLQLLLLDKAQQLCGVGLHGELYVGGPGLARGYLHRPDLTAERFIPNHFSDAPGQRLYRSGDEAKYNTNWELEYTCRTDQQVKIRGFRVETGEIEVLLTGHEDVVEALVLAREDEGFDKRLVAYLVPRAGAQLSINELRAWLQQALPDYMVPSAFVVLDALPLTNNGKIDRRALPAPGSERPSLFEAYVAPRNETEEVLAAVWSKVLGLKAVGIKDNFFAIGGDSIRSIQVIALAQERGVHHTLAQLFKQQTIEGLVDTIRASMSAGVAGVKILPFALVSDEDRTTLPLDVEDAYPLTMLQAGMLFHMESVGDTIPYVNVNSIYLEVRLDLEKFREAVDLVVARHPVLRTSFDLSRYSEPLQLVHKTASLPIGVYDLRSLAAEEQQTIVDQFIAEEAKRPFDFECPPQLCFNFHLLSDTSLYFTLKESHAIFDGWSLHATLNEIFTVYRALLHDQPLPDLSPLESSFRDFVLLERAACDSEQARSFWREKLSDLTTLELPYRNSFSAEAKPRRILIRRVPIGVELSEALARLAISAAVPLKSVLLAAHMKVLSLISGQSDVITGVTSHGRPEQKDGEQVRGLFLNTVPFRSRLADGSWLDVIRGVFKTEQEILPFRRYPLAQMRKDQHVGPPLFDTNFNFINFHVVRGALQSNEMRFGEFKKREATNFSLVAGFALDLMSSEIGLELNYDEEALSSEQMESIARYYLATLQSMVRDPRARHEFECLLSDEEQQQFVARVIAQPPATSESLVALFEKQVEQNPDAPALVFDDDQLSYRELNWRANQLAHLLIAKGIRSENIVGICLERAPKLVVAMLAVLKAGGAYVPLDPTYPEDRLAFMLADSQAAFIITESHLLDHLGAPEAAVICLDEQTATLAAENPEITVDPENLAYLIYTSGSTGKPKAAMITHRNVARLFTATAADFNFGPDDVWTMFHSYAFDFSVWEIWGALLYGGRLIIVPYWVSRNPEAFYELVADAKVTVLNQTPSAFRQFMQADEVLQSELALRFIVFGGETLDVASLRGWTRRHGTDQPQLINMYGITETTVHVTYRRLSVDDIEHATRSGVGRAIADLNLNVLDSRQQFAPLGVRGELCVGGEGLARGYLGRPELTAERFIPDPYASQPGERLYRSGDEGRYLRLGDVEYLGRKDQQVKIRGFRIETGEIESVLRAHDGVSESVVVAREGREREKFLVAYVVPAAFAEVNQGELRSWVQAKLPDYMVPSHFVMLTALPLTASGKLDRRALPEPMVAREADVVEYIAPRNEIEELLATEWKKLLNLDQVSIRDNFFELGGDSLSAARLAHLLRRSFGVRVPVQTIFEARTIADLAESIEKALGREQDAPAIKPVSRDGALPLSFTQARIWFSVKQEGPNPTPWRNILLGYRLLGPLNVDALDNTIKELARRHELLRTTFPEVDGNMAPRILPAPSEMLRVIDLRAVPEPEQGRQVDQIITDSQQRPFKLTQEILMKATLLQLSEQEHVLFFVIDHFIFDGWSKNVFTTELADIYAAYYHDQPSPLAELEVQFVDYAAWHREKFQGDKLKKFLDYWKEKLDAHGPFPKFELPDVLPKPAIATDRSQTHRLLLPHGLLKQLDALCRNKRVTMFMLIMAALKTLLHAYTGKEKIGVISNTANRQQPETQHVIGFLSTMVILRTDLSGNPTFSELLERVRTTCMAGYEHGDLPLHNLIASLRTELPDGQQLDQIDERVELDNAALGLAEPFVYLNVESLGEDTRFAQQRLTEKLQLADLTIKPLHWQAPEAVRSPGISIFASEVAEGLSISVESEVDRYRSETMTELVELFRLVFEAIIADSEQSLSDLVRLIREPR